MISSRNTTTLPSTGVDNTPVDLTTVRRSAKERIQKEGILGHTDAVDVWINEDEGAAAATQDSWDTCMQRLLVNSSQPVSGSTNVLGLSGA